MATDILINSGGSNYTATDGRVWSADNSFTGGQTYSNTEPISGTADDLLYQTERYGNFSYNISIANGTYRVILHFAEIWWGVKRAGGVGSRVFHVDIEGVRVLQDFDILAETTPATALIKTFSGISVNDGVLTIAYTAVVNNAKSSAIEVVPDTSNTFNESISLSAASQVLESENLSANEKLLLESLSQVTNTPSANSIYSIDLSTLCQISSAARAIVDEQIGLTTQAEALSGQAAYISEALSLGVAAHILLQEAYGQLISESIVLSISAQIGAYARAIADTVLSVSYLMDMSLAQGVISEGQLNLIIQVSHRVAVNSSVSEMLKCFFGASVTARAKSVVNSAIIIAARISPDILASASASGLASLRIASSLIHTARALTDLKASVDMIASINVTSQGIITRVTLPDGRTFVVRSDDRTYRIEPDIRTYRIEPDDRTYRIEP